MIEKKGKGPSSENSLVISNNPYHSKSLQIC